MNVLIVAPFHQKEVDKITRHFPNDEFKYCCAEDMTQDMVDSCDVIIGNPAPHVDINKEHLKAILLHFAGSDTFVQPGVIHENTRLANASGSYGKAIAEHTIGLLLALNKNFRAYFHQMDQHVWKKQLGGKELLNRTVLIVGLGDLGYALAKRLKSFDCKIIGVKKTLTNNFEYVDELHTIDQIDLLLPKADYVILALPQNKETYHLFDKERLAKMKKDAVLVNVGRGSAISTEDLIATMKQGHLYGAILDVVEEEPLIDTSPLWALENVLITPHASGGFEWQSVHDYYVDLVIRNLHHVIKEEPLENEVDRISGYRSSRIYEEKV